MRSIKVDEEKERLAFALKAADAFAKWSGLATYTEGDVVSGCYLAIRWGIHGRAVVVVKLDEYEEPVNYHDLVPAIPAAAGDHQGPRC